MVWNLCPEGLIEEYVSAESTEGKWATPIQFSPSFMQVESSKDTPKVCEVFNFF